MRFSFKYIIAVLLLFTVPMISMTYAATANDLLQCKQSIDASLDALVFPPDPDSNQERDVLGYLQKLDAVFSTDLSTGKLIDDAISTLRVTHRKLESVCAVFSNIPSSATSRSLQAIDTGLYGCSVSEFNNEDLFNLILYCDQKKTALQSLIKDHLRSVILRDAQQKSSTKLVERFRDINMKLRTLSEQAVRFSQNVNKLNSAIGGVITTQCSE
jgi:hypothetical protein